MRLLTIMLLLALTACDSQSDRQTKPDRSAHYTNATGKSIYAGMINQVSMQEGVDPKLVHAVIQQESNYDPNAVSHAGAAGLMQLMPATARDYGLEPSERFNPRKNVQAGTRHLKMLLRMFNQNVRLALAAYNAGQGNVMKYGYTVPPFAETQTYVKRVTGFYNSSRNLSRMRQLRARTQQLTKPSQALAMTKSDPETTRTEDPGDEE